MAADKNKGVRAKKKPDGAGPKAGGAPRIIENFFDGFKIKPLSYAWVDAKTMKPHPLNWKIHPKNQIAEIDKSLEEFGWLPSMLTLFNKRTGHVIDAHGRRESAIKNKKQVPVAIIDVDEETERRILASLDKVGELRDTDNAALEQLLASIMLDSGKLPAGYENDALEQLQKALQIPGQLPPRLDEGFGSGSSDKSRDVYEVGAEVTCPHCEKTFKLP